MRPSTFSIVARDPEAGEIGVAVQSKFIAVGSVVPWVASDAGAIATQAWANASFGPDGLAMLRDGMSAEETLATLLGRDEGREHRQVGIVDLRGGVATFTGASCIDAANGVAGEDFVAQGNCLASLDVVPAMATAFRATRGTLADRLVAALVAAQAVGGDKRGQQSAALVVCKPGGGYGGFTDRYVDLRVDDHPRPIEELARVLDLYKLYCFRPSPDEILTIDAPLGAQLTRDLVRIERLPREHGAWDDDARAALVRFMHEENFEDRVLDGDRVDVRIRDYLAAYRPA